MVCRAAPGAGAGAAGAAPLARASFTLALSATGPSRGVRPDRLWAKDAFIRLEGFNRLDQCLFGLFAEQ